MSTLRCLLLSLACAGLLTAVAGCAASQGAPAGKGGSMARFVIKDHYLFALSRHHLRVLSLKQGDTPRLVRGIAVATRQAETLFLAKDRLFVGARDGMYIYDVKIPTEPRLLAGVRHFRSCDPVVVQGRYAFVTLRKGGRCWRGKNALLVYDVSDSRRPQLLKSYPMTNPWGLGIDGHLLFVADGRAGLKVFDATNPLALVHLSTHPTIQGYDVIPHEQILIVSAEDGLYQLDYRTGSLRYLSRIPIGNPRRAPVRIDAPLKMVAPPPPPPRKKIPRS
jgi:hypothetical protein